MYLIFIIVCDYLNNIKIPLRVFILTFKYLIKMYLIQGDIIYIGLNLILIDAEFYFKLDNISTV